MRGRVSHRRAGLVLLAVVLVLPLSAGAAPAADGKAAPVVGSDFRISGSQATALEADAAVAWNGDATEYLVVWEDERDEATRGSDIYGRRVDADGSHLGEDFAISAALTDQEDPAIVSTGAGYLVLWVDSRTLNPRGTDIYGQRLSATGELIGDPFRVCGAGALGFDHAPAIAWDGSETLVVWSDGRNDADRGTDVYGRRVSADGAPQGADFRISGTNAVADEYNPAVAWNGTGYLVVWEDSRDDAARGVDVRGRRVSAAGAPEGKDFRISGTSATADDNAPAVASGSGNFLVVWQDSRMLPDRQLDIYGRVVSAAGKPVGANFRVCGLQATGYDWVPAVTWDGTIPAYLVVWQDERSWADRGADIYGRRIAGEGSRIGGDFRISGPGATDSEYSPAVTWNGSSHLVVWQDARDATTRGRDIWGRRVDL